MTDAANSPPQVGLSASPEMMRGAPSNRIEIISDPAGFTLTFLNYVMGEPVISMSARVCMSPETALALSENLAENIKMFEANCGAIRRAGMFSPKVVFDATKQS